MRRTSVGGGLLAGVGLVMGTAVLGSGVASARAGAASDWAWPLADPYAVSRPFAPPAHRYGTGHRGADLPAQPGAVVTAAGSGRVSYAGPLAGRGVVVVVHGSLRTTYEPVLAAVSPGQAVAAGELLGVLEPGHPGCPVQACLHWGLRRGEDYLDPVRLVDRGPVRLLPLGPGVGRLPESDGAAGEVMAGAPAAPEPTADGRTSQVVGLAAVVALAAGAAGLRRSPS